MPTIFRCSLCSVHKFSLSKLVSHVALQHQHEPNFQIGCAIGICQEQFKTFHAYKKHAYRKHAGLMKVENVEVVDDDFIETASDNHNMELGDENFNKFASSEHVSVDALLAGLKEHFALFLLKLLEKTCCNSSCSANCV